MDNYPYAQSGYQGPQTADVIREASLRNKADEATGYLRQAHNLMDELEDALNGPSPRAGEKGAPEAPGHPGARAVLALNSQLSATLVSRISTLLGSL